MNPAMETYLWTTGSALAATGGTAHGKWRADGVSIDSRTTKPGDLFVAIRGPKFDGHDFAADAFAASAAAAVVERRPDAVSGDAPLL